MKRLVWFNEITTGDVSSVGGKGLSLGLMTQAGIPVPPGFVITTAISGGIEQVKRELFEAFDTLGVERVAVRSSAIAEDSEAASWAGQFESYLNVDREGLIKAIQDCWESVEAAQEYASTQDVSDDQLALAVVVQSMVASEVSGIAFSVNPISREQDEIMIEAIYGLGELIVQGMVTPDNYVVSKETGSTISSQLATKPTMLAYSNGETEEVSVASELQDDACLNEDQLAELKDIIIRIEDYYGLPQDIEWAYTKGKFYIVQSRPITTL